MTHFNNNDKEVYLVTVKFSGNSDKEYDYVSPFQIPCGTKAFVDSPFNGITEVTVVRTTTNRRNLSWWARCDQINPLNVKPIIGTRHKFSDTIEEWRNEYKNNDKKHKAVSELNELHKQIRDLQDKADELGKTINRL